MDIQISLEGLTEITGMLTNYPEIAAKHLQVAMQKSTLLLQREIAEAVPTGAHQLLRKSIFSEVHVSETGFLGVVGTSSPYALAVELGTKPHFPPIAPLIDWVIAKLGVEAKQAPSVAYLVARKISKKGTVGQFYFANTVAKQTPTVQRYFTEAREAIMDEMIQQGKA